VTGKRGSDGGWGAVAAFGTEPGFANRETLIGGATLWVASGRSWRCRQIPRRGRASGCDNALRERRDEKKETAGSVSCQPFRLDASARLVLRLPASAAVTAATVEAAATAYRAAAANCATTAESARCEAAARSHSTTESWGYAAAESWVTAESGSSKTAPVEAWPATVETATVEAGSPTVEPWAGADEDAAREILRPVVPVRRASVRVVAVVAVFASRRTGCVARTYADTNADGSNAYSNSNLCVSRRAS
jgi:hypothetical protein